MLSLLLKHINHHFSLERPLIQDLSLSLEEGRVYGLMGSNGAGKTTLFNIISGFLKQNSGELVFEGKDLSQRRVFERNRMGISRTFQDMRTITKLSVKDNIVLSMKGNPTDTIGPALLPSACHRNAIDALERKADEIIEQFFLSQVKDSLAGEISYGQQKLLTLACCLANGASLLLLDEPVAGVQPEYRNKIAVLINQLKQQGKTILLIEHNTDFIAAVADKIFFLNEGKVVTFENIETLKLNQDVLKAYL